MVDVDFTPRRVYDAVQDAARAIMIAGPGHYEETNPAVVVEPGWQSIISAEASGNALAQAQEPGSSVTFTFQGHTVDLIARRGIEEGRLIVTLDGRTVGGLPTDADGRSYLDLSAPTTVWQARLPIAHGLSSGQHVIRLTADPGSEPGRTIVNVDAFEVNTGRPPPFPILAVAVILIAMLVVLAALFWDLRRQPRRERFF
jgi:hypothetical protein